MQDAPQHEICVHRERRMKEYVMPTHAAKKEMPAMMSINTSDPESSGAIFNVLIGKKDERCASDQDS